MVSKTSIKYLHELQNAVKCSYQECESTTGMFENTVTLPCGHHFCSDCAIDGIDKYDGCTICHYPCWGKDAKPNYTLNRVIEHITTLTQLAKQIQLYENNIVYNHHKDIIKPIIENKDNIVMENDGNNTITPNKIELNEDNMKSRSGATLQITVEESDNDDDDIIDPSRFKKSRYISNSAPAIISTSTNHNIELEEEILSANSVSSTPVIPAGITNHVLPSSSSASKGSSSSNIQSPSTTSISSMKTPKIIPVSNTIFGNSNNENSTNITPLSTIHNKTTTMPPPSSRTNASTETSSKLTEHNDPTIIHHTPLPAVDPPLTPAAFARTPAINPSMDIVVPLSSSNGINNYSSEPSSSTITISKLNSPNKNQVVIVQKSHSSEDSDDDDDGPLPINRRSKKSTTVINTNNNTTNKIMKSAINSSTIMVTQNNDTKVTKAVSKTHKPLVIESSTGSTTTSTVDSSLVSPSVINSSSIIPSSSTNTRSSHKPLNLIPSSSSQISPTITTSPSTVTLSSTLTTSTEISTRSFEPIYGIGGANRAKQTGKIVVCPTGINSEEDCKVLDMLEKVLKCTVVDTFDPATVTHVITVVNSNDNTGPPNYQPISSRTLKYVQGILCGCWIVTLDWARTCCTLGTHVDETSFEIGRDRSARKHCTTPLWGRQAALEKKLPLFYQQHFYILEPLSRLSIKDLELCIQCGGGIIETVDPYVQLQLLEKKKYTNKEEKDNELQRIQNIITITSFDLGVCDDYAMEQLRKKYTSTKYSSLIIVDQIWLLDCVSNWTKESLIKWTFNGEGTNMIRKKYKNK